MFNKAVFKQAVKSNWVMFVVILIVMQTLLLQFSAIKQLSSMLPEIYYGLMFLLVPSIYVLITSNKLLCSQVDSGALAYTLATKVKRESIIFTQVVFLLGSLFIIYFMTTVINLVTNQIVPVYTSAKIIALNFSGFCAMAAITGICYMFSCIFNLQKRNLGVTGGITLLFVLASMLGMFSKMGMGALKFFNYITVFSLCDTGSIAAGTTTWIICFVCSLVIAAATFVIGGVVFKKKDLPL